MKYKVKFEFFGKYMQTEITADNRLEAMQKVRERVNFKEITAIKEESDANVEFLMGIFGMKK